MSVNTVSSYGGLPTDKFSSGRQPSEIDLQFDRQGQLTKLTVSFDPTDISGNDPFAKNTSSSPGSGTASSGKASDKTGGKSANAPVSSTSKNNSTASGNTDGGKGLFNFDGIKQIFADLLDALGFSDAAKTLKSETQSSPASDTKGAKGASADSHAGGGAGRTTKGNGTASGTNKSSGAGATTNVKHSDLSDFDTSRPPPSKLSPEEGDKLALQVMDHLIKDFDLTPEQAAGVVGNLSYESDGMNPHVNEYAFSGGQDFGEPVANDKGYGWAQWSYDRKPAFLSYSQDSGFEVGSPAANYAMLKHELETTESKTIPALQAASTPQEAALAFRKVFERAELPNDSPRLANADKYLAKYNSTEA